MLRIQQGQVFISLGVLHTCLALSPWAFGDQFARFAKQGGFNVSDGLLEFPIMDGDMNYENFASFWFFYFGLFLVLLGILVNHIEKRGVSLPRTFILGYLTLTGLGTYMIPLSGMTFLMLPHAIFMLAGSKRHQVPKP